MPVEEHQARGVAWAYLEGDASDADERTCGECDRRFVATAWFSDADGRDKCPECHPVESAAHALREALAETLPRPRRVDVDGGPGR